jgi:guanine deaminase
MANVRLPDRPPFRLRSRLVSPLQDGAFLDIADGIVEVDERGRIAWIGPADERSAASDGAAAPSMDGAAPSVDLRGLVVTPGLIDLHAHLPQLPNAGLGHGLDLLTWLERYIFPLERGFDESAAQRIAPLAFRSMAALGTTTVVAYGAVYEGSLDVAFRAAEEHGIRTVLGKVMMDRLRYDPTVSDAEVLELSLRQSSDLCDRWHGRDHGRLRYAFTPRFAVACSADMLRESAQMARDSGAHWQTHLSEDAGEIAEVAALFPEARDYLDVYDRAGGLFERALFAHAVHLSDREVARLVEAGAAVAHCPASNLFLASGVMPLARYLDAGVRVGLGSDVAGGPDLSLFTVMRVGAYTQNALRVVRDEPGEVLDAAGWLRLATLDGARALGLDAAIGSLEVGKEADLIAIDPAMTEPIPARTEPIPVRESVADEFADPADAGDLIGRLIFRAHPSMVRGAWVRGRLLATTDS